MRKDQVIVKLTDNTCTACHKHIKKLTKQDEHEHNMNFGRDSFADYTCRRNCNIACLYNAMLKTIPTTSGWKIV